MPKIVDHDERREMIIQSALEVLSEGGPRMLTMRGLAARLGGSLRVVNHYYPSRRSLLEDLEPRMTERWEEDLKQLDAESCSPRSRLRSFLIWALATDEEDRIAERAWISLLSAPPEDADSVATLHAHGALWMRRQIEKRLEGLVPLEALESTTDQLQIATRGIVVTAEENPDLWPAGRQIAAIEGLLRLLGLADEKPGLHGDCVGDAGQQTARV